jgi:hypothetical protein
MESYRSLSNVLKKVQKYIWLEKFYLDLSYSLLILCHLFIFSVVLISFYLVSVLMIICKFVNF